MQFMRFNLYVSTGRKVNTMTPVNRSIPLFLFFLLTGCSTFISDFMQPSHCAMTVWNRPIDALNTQEFPERNHTGDEFILTGIIRDSESCEPLADATLIFDMTNDESEYDGTQSGQLTTNALGFFTIRSNRPGAYGGGHPHMHLFIGKAGYSPITASYDLLTPSSTGWIELALTPHDADTD